MTLSSTSGTQSDRTPWIQLIGLAAGLAIAAGAAFALGGWDGGSSAPSRSTVPRAPTASVTSPDRPAYLLVVIARSQDEADAYASLLMQNAEPAGLSISYRVVTNDEDAEAARLLYSQAAQELMAHGISFEMVDLLTSQTWQRD